MARRGRTMRVGLGIAAAAAAMALAAPSTSPAAVTIGADTSTPTTSYNGCSDAEVSCLFAQLSSPSNVASSPFDGVIVRWRIVGDSEGKGIKLQVVRPLGSGLFTGAGSSTPEVVTPGGERTFETRLPINSGDHIGATLPGGAVRAPVASLIGIVSAPAPAQSGFWSPALGDGESPGRAPSGISSGQELLFNGDVEADCDGDGFGDETQDADIASCNPPPSTCAGKQPTVVGTEGSDVLLGTNKKDVIAALAGDDQVKAKNGKDVVCGGLGNDLLKGGNGKDQLNGEDGTDTCKGGRGKDKGSSCETSGKIP